MILVRRLVWDTWNEPHIARHVVTRDEVEEVCHGDSIVREAQKGRLMVIGPTHARRVLAVILDPETEEGVYYPITARPADRRERRIYQAEKRGES
jgi:uncharacterized DUF497 family protein